MKKVFIFIFSILAIFTSLPAKGLSEDKMNTLNRHYYFDEQNNIFYLMAESYYKNVRTGTYYEDLRSPFYAKFNFKNKTKKDIFYRYLIPTLNTDSVEYEIGSDVKVLHPKETLYIDKNSCLEILNGKIKYELKVSYLGDWNPYTLITTSITEMNESNLNLVTKSLTFDSFIYSENVDADSSIKNKNFYINNCNKTNNEVFVLKGQILFNKENNNLEIHKYGESNKIILNKSIYEDYAIENPLFIQQYIITENNCSLYFVIDNEEFKLKNVEGLRTEIITQAIVKHFDLLEKYSFFFDEYYDGIPKDLNDINIFGYDVDPFNSYDVSNVSQGTLFYIPYGKIYEDFGNNKYLYSFNIPTGYGSSQVQNVFAELEYDPNNKNLTNINKRALFCEFEGFYKTVEGEIILQLKVKYPVAKKDPLLNGVL